MFLQQVLILRYVSVIVIGNAQIKQKINDERKIKQREIHSVLLGAGYILHIYFHKNPERLYQQVKKNKKKKIGKKFLLHEEGGQK